MVDKIQELTSLVKPLAHRIEEISSSAANVEKRIKFIKKDALYLNADFSQITKNTQNVIHHFSFLSGTFPIAKLALDTAALELALEGKNEKIADKPIQQMILGLSITKDLQQIAFWARDWGFILLSEKQNHHLDLSKPAVKFFKSLMRFADKLHEGSALQTIGLAFLKLSVASFSFYTKFFQSKTLKQLLNPLSAAVEVTGHSLKLQKLIQKMTSKGVSRTLLLESLNTTASLGLSITSLLSFGCGPAFRIPLLLYALTCMRLGTQAALFACDYL